MNLTHEIGNGVCRLEIEGEATIFHAAELKEELLAAMTSCAEGGIEMEVVLAQVSEIDAAGLQLLALCKREAAARKLTLRFSGHSPAVLDLLNLSNLAGSFGDPSITTCERD